jgi:D-alanine-D-alanine ligase
MGDKLNVWIICGGRSAEHEVSLCSARSIASALDRSKYHLHFVTITKEGKWESRPVLEGHAAEVLEGPSRDRDACPSPAAYLSGDGLKGLVENVSFPGIDEAPVNGDGRMIVFPVLHGPYGEDGTIQGLLEMLDIPYVGSGVLGSALAMDKVKAKEVLFHRGIPVARWIAFQPGNGDSLEARIPETVDRLIGYPCFVKPANLGSSVGITKVKRRDALDEAINLARRYDRKVLIEEAIDAREIECSVLGNDTPIASIPGEVVPGKEFYDYEAKYAEAGTELMIPAELLPEQVERVQRLAIQAFGALECCGMARVDFFLDRGTGRIIVNELNTIPGFTEVSMYPRLWEASGIPYPRLLDRLVQLGLERHEQRKELAVNRD